MTYLKRGAAALLAALFVARQVSPRLRLLETSVVLGLPPVLRVVVRRLLFGPLQPTWSWRFELALEVMRSLPPANDLALMRKNTSRAFVAAPEYTRSHKLSVEGVPAEWIDGGTVTAAEPPVILYLHGGAYVLCSIASHRGLIARISRSTRARCLAIEYRLAPEHPFPAGLDDAVSVYSWLISPTGGNTPPSRVFVAGDSAGGGLSLALMLTLRERGLPMPAGAILLSPWVDLTVSSPSWRTNIRYDYLKLDYRNPFDFPRMYAGEQPLEHPLISPLNADLCGLPPLLIQAGSAETLIDEDTAFARKAKQAGVAVDYEVYNGMVHVFQAFGALCAREARTAFHSMALFVDRVLEDQKKSAAGGEGDVRPRL